MHTNVNLEIHLDIKVPIYMNYYIWFDTSSQIMSHKNKNKIITPNKY